MTAAGLGLDEVDIFDTRESAASNVALDVLSPSKAGVVGPELAKELEKVSAVGLDGLCDCLRNWGVKLDEEAVKVLLSRTHTAPPCCEHTSMRE